MPAKKCTWEESVAWARGTPDMAPLVELCYYDDPIETAARRFKASEEWQAIKAFLPPRQGAKVLEIGAGRGIVSWAFASEGCEVHAIEPDPSALVGAGAIRSLCGATGQTITIVESVGERLDLAEGCFDYVVCRGVLHHVSDLPQVCREVYRVLRPGGRFLAIKEHAADTPDELAAFLKTHALHHLYGGEHAFPFAAYVTSLREAGFPRVVNYGHFDHPITSAPAIKTAAIRDQFVQAIAARTSTKLGVLLAGNDRFLRLYRRWLTFRSRIPGRLHSFLAEKPV
jgi:2-polyprenyl-3-methyl-5-hydroxy-6-metoxy-1,4-benzoquinol methylase